ncbi:MAG: aspartate--tRNA(Asn) ligase [Candidatus Micrarchaeaceae archaeon]
MIRTHMINELNAGMDGSEVTLAGWVHEVRETSKIVFLILRDSTGIVQVVAKKGEVSDSIVKDATLPKESVVEVKGTVRRNAEAKKGFEIIPKSISNLNPLSRQVPFEVTGKVPAEIDVRLNHRYVDLRRLEVNAIFKIESTILQSFRDFLMGKGFREIRTPTIVGEATEGGSEVFPVVYFEKEAFLAQSPQLYKQLALIGGMDKVFMVVPVFRAEKSNTVYHLTEVTQMDIEMAFADADDAIKLLGDAVTYIIGQVTKKNKEDLDTLGVDLEVPEVKTVTYNEAVAALQKKGITMKHGEDFPREAEEKLNDIYGDAIILRDYPRDVRAFYTMPKEDDPELTNSYDFLYKGLEISSGAQRIHNPEMLVESLKRKGLNPENFAFYVDAFRVGAPPHAGWSIGLERLAMRITGSKNIRECSLFPRDRKRLAP